MPFWLVYICNQSINKNQSFHSTLLLTRTSIIVGGCTKGGYLLSVLFTSDKGQCINLEGVPHYKMKTGTGYSVIPN